MEMAWKGTSRSSTKATRAEMWSEFWESRNNTCEPTLCTKSDQDAPGHQELPPMRVPLGLPSSSPPYGPGGSQPEPLLSLLPWLLLEWLCMIIPFKFTSFASWVKKSSSPPSAKPRGGGGELSPASTTNRTPSMVTEVSAMLVEMMHFRTPGGGRPKI